MTMAAVCSTSESDTDLAARFALEAEPLFDVLLRGARRLTRSQADAEDLLQDTLLHAYAGFRTFQEGTKLKAWLFSKKYDASWENALTVVQEVQPPFIPDGGHVMTVVIEYPPG